MPSPGFVVFFFINAYSLLHNFELLKIRQNIIQFNNNVYNSIFFKAQRQYYYSLKEQKKKNRKGKLKVVAADRMGNTRRGRELTMPFEFSVQESRQV